MIHVIKVLLEVKKGWANPRLVSFKAFIQNFRRASPPLSYESPPRDFGLSPPQSSLFWVCPACFQHKEGSVEEIVTGETFEAVECKGCFRWLFNRPITARTQILVLTGGGHNKDFSAVNQSLVSYVGRARETGMRSSWTSFSTQRYVAKKYCYFNLF